MPNNLQKQREEFAGNFLMEAVRFLKSQEPAKREPHGIIEAGTAASLLTKRKAYRKLRTIWNQTLTKEAFKCYKGKKFNEVVAQKFHPQDLQIIKRDEFREYVGQFEPGYIQLCAIEEIPVQHAVEIAKSQHHLLEIGITYAILGNYEMARKFVECPELEKGRQDYIKWVIETEKLRDGNFINPDLSVLGLEDWGMYPWNAGYVALCALGRLPFFTYPYPDW